MRLRNKVLSASAIASIAISTPFIADFEGLRTEAYLDPVGIPTICYGHTLDVEMGDVYSRVECRLKLNEELLVYLKAVDDYIYVPMTNARRAALTSFAYNVGIENFKRSTLRRLMNQGKTKAACDQLSRWIFAKGIRLRGLIRRREAERLLCMEGLPIGI